MHPPIMFRSVATLVKTLSLCALAVGANASTASPLVDLEYARYRGQRNSSGVDQFLGMRYAASPPL